MVFIIVIKTRGVPTILGHLSANAILDIRDQEPSVQVRHLEKIISKLLVSPCSSPFFKI